MSWDDDNSYYEDQSWWQVEDRIREEQQEREDAHWKSVMDDWDWNRRRDAEIAEDRAYERAMERADREYEESLKSGAWDSDSGYSSYGSSGRRRAKAVSSNPAALWELVKWLAVLAACWAAAIGQAVLQNKIVSVVLMVGSILFSLGFSFAPRDEVGHGLGFVLFFLISLVLRAAGVVTAVACLLAMLTTVFS